MIAPFLPALGFNSAVELGILVSVTGAGSMVVSHTNDSYFWVVSQFGGMSMQQTLRTFTVATLLQGMAVLISAMVLRSEARRVGKECVRTCISGGSTYH